MHVIRLVLVLLVILIVVVAYNPQAREQAVKTWEKLRPTVVGVTDSLYVAIRDLVIGTSHRDQLNQPSAPMPGENFQRIVTLRSSFAV